MNIYNQISLRYRLARLVKLPLRDRLRAVECPSEIIDQLGGWSLKSVGQGYGRGYELSKLKKWMLKLS